MGTSNFYNHENGIYVMPETEYEYALGFLLEIRNDLLELEEPELTAEDIEEDEIYQEMFQMDEDNARYFLEGLFEEMPSGMYAKEAGKSSYTVYNNNGLVIAECNLVSGYYAGYQVIVETDPTKIRETADYDGYPQSDLLEVYSPHHKRLLKYVAKHTEALVRVGGFSDGTSVYEKA